MSDPNRDVTLPWQCTVLAIMWVIGLLAAGLLALVSMRGIFPADVRAHIKPCPTGYLAGAVVLTPLLVIGGRRTVRRWRQEDGAGAQSRLGRVTHVSPAKGITIGVMGICLAILPVWAVQAGRLDPITGFATAGALLGGSVSGMIRHLNRR